MGCACNKNRDQFEVVRDGGTGRVVFRSGNQSTALGVAGRYTNSVVRNAKTGAVVEPGTGALEITASDGAVLFRTDDQALAQKVLTAHDGSTARDTKTGVPLSLTAP